ncbi:MAG TPA: formate/nitrite transporter family protein [Ktedonobacteraceae bacterium]|jgi:formate/nitrite transporter FocA (FNT family)|nr:formate/nitrite transporter family protein [Ktedonobacteraceae bacterium]
MRRKPERPVEIAEPELIASSSGVVPELSKGERKEVARRARISAVIVHETVREEGERELKRAPAALALSALAAGLSMGFSLVAQGLLHAYLPAAPWRPLVDNLGYSVGFFIVVLGRQQLFTENTLTAMLPLFAHPNWHTFWKVARLWAVVLAANLLGAFLFATIIAHTDVFQPQIRQSFTEVAFHSLRGDFGLTVLRGIFAGWLIALMVWLLPASENTKLHIVILLTYLVALGSFAHIIAGSVDVLYLVNTGAVSWATYLLGFMLPTLIGNIIGGASLVGALNFGQVAAETVGANGEM